MPGFSGGDTNSLIYVGKLDVRVYSFLFRGFWIIEMTALFLLQLKPLDRILQCCLGSFMVGLSPVAYTAWEKQNLLSNNGHNQSVHASRSRDTK